MGFRFQKEGLFVVHDNRFRKEVLSPTMPLSHYLFVSYNMLIIHDKVPADPEVNFSAAQLAQVFYSLAILHILLLSLTIYLQMFKHSTIKC